jgi:hypothetical protein
MEGTIWRVLLCDAVTALVGGILCRLDLLPALATRILTKPRIVCFCQPVALAISARVTPLARFIIAITSAVLLVRASVALRIHQ